ncbi:monofunctional biosynthetic peptidoglycan transglycosylase [Elizabethkingia meningoseptica]|uniref:monofunctional biosynthetic peptidoglycan transglycosylase n=1 Tax=Elizabethkingia meningoseptica TaxID=238 RepID=UPI000332D486|nr:monofunctional biosynthetic peptidoglycan transglycosylase [Elizabethkingia meningoseptica]AQX05471.1 monofunctional biosynthetic peptidoglycan transglycosylase [Elizabethkingia meningoseptica]AQX47514.1 monofunctional biosynthetic peptidoglycan transglycosylase [Elizabethkingia meningoseptica]EOR29506.1 Membrane carboxypeptidase (penicillin-binding protein) [Elizabethkingia meningoseptica ATCC 13253 = NBRC 12535]KUY24220.1 monofunctional biosynthetic peptidoglycan transglycosylase [Elizabet
MWKFIKRVIFAVIVFNILAVIWGRFFNPPITFIQLGGLVQYGKLDRDYISFDEMGDNVKLAVIASEDQNYFKHNGFDFKAIERAMKHNEKKNKKTIQGGSTISQQTAKNIFLWNGRSWVRKGLEVVYTFIIEHLWNKDIILERYLNSIEMGRGVFGVEAASKYYFGKSAKDLTKSEAAWIAAVLPNPKKYDPKNPSPYLQKKHSWIMKQMGYMKLN